MQRIESPILMTPPETKEEQELFQLSSENEAKYMSRLQEAAKN
jgi:hypothetical protein